MDPDVRAEIDLAIERAVDEACRSEMTWGRDDCVLWCANILRPFLNCDPAATYRGRYASEAEALTVMGYTGLPMVIARAAQDMGWRRIVPADAECGDVGIVRTMFGPACVLFWRAQQWVGRADFGFSTAHRNDARFAWSIG